MTQNSKCIRKKKRFAARLKSSKGIICTDIQGPCLVLCNIGQGTGLDKEGVNKLITDSGLSIKIHKFIAVKGETHSYVVFSNTEDALLFYNAHNEITTIDEHGSLLYISFVEDVPSNEILCEHDNPSGLQILNNFISIDEEKAFLKLFDWVDTESNLKNRQVKHYGYEFRYGSNDVDLGNPLLENIPGECNILWERLKQHGIELDAPDQLTVNKYCPGQGIPSHVDRHSPFGDTILSLSLGSSVVMDWKHHSGKYVPVVVEPRSLLVMKGEARYDWQHGIQPRTWDPIIEERTSHTSPIENHDPKLIKVITNETKPRETRISLTFRWTRTGPCDCEYKTLCDRNKTDDIEDGVASNLEELHVHQVYEQIAGHFSTTRHKPWPKVVEFMSAVEPGAVVADLGCGNGKNILRRNDVLQIAGERSSGLAAECRRRVRAVAAADCARLDLLHAGLRDACADVVICIAVIHHFSSKARRIQAISTIARILRKRGRALITVWAKDQTKSNYLCKTKLNRPVPDQQHLSIGGLQLPVHENRTQFQHNDLLVPWKLRNITDNKLSNEAEHTLLRYYHVFEENELDQLCNEVPNVIVEKTFYEEGNWCVIIKKI